jgi:hypothetical protein
LNSSLQKIEKYSPGFQLKLKPILQILPDQAILFEKIGADKSFLFIEADEIVTGNVRLFGGKPSPLQLTFPEPLEYWTAYEKGNHPGMDQDIKYVWEPARFSWACKLAMAYHLSKNEKYAESFWLYTEKFINSNPPYLGPHWSSAQEVAIRLVALVFSLQMFSQSQHSTAERLENIARSIAIHAERIPPTLVYARSQNNNHLITEALGLYTASAVLPDYPQATRWHKLGWKWLRKAIISQISPFGAYIQHSTNYHRLVLQAALWVYVVHEHSFKDEPIPAEYTSRLQSASRWLYDMMDPVTGRVPNMGHNDGAYILPLTVCPYHDYRPVYHSAKRAFLKTNPTPGGPWDDMSAWLCLPMDIPPVKVQINRWYLPPIDQGGMNKLPPHIIKNPKNGSWATFRVLEYHARPAHADQLHLDLWWHGENLAQDAGTYLYNSQPPWDNSLASAFVHNTVVVDNQDFMQRVGRFLYLDWAQARLLSSYQSQACDCESYTARHNGYRKMGIIHSREVTAHPDGHWEIIDRLKGRSIHPHHARLHWLLPDWDFIVSESSKNSSSGYEIKIKSPYGWVRLNMGMTPGNETKLINQDLNFIVARAGEVVYGNGMVLPIHGWISPTYGEKKPALSCILDFTHNLPVEFKSEWILPSEG